MAAEATFFFLSCNALIKSGFVVCIPSSLSGDCTTEENKSLSFMLHNEGKCNSETFIISRPCHRFISILAKISVRFFLFLIFFLLISMQ